MSCGNQQPATADNPHNLQNRTEPQPGLVTLRSYGRMEFADGSQHNALVTFNVMPLQDAFAIARRLEDDAMESDDDSGWIEIVNSEGRTVYLWNPKEHG